MSETLDEQNLFKALNPTRQTYSVLGNICRNPTVLKEPEIIIGARDFVQDFHKITFGAIFNLAYSKGDVKEITEIDIDNYLANYPTHYKIWDDADGMKYIQDARKTANNDMFENDYHTLKKFSLLRNYVECGIDVADLYNYKTNDLRELTDSMKKLDELEIVDIIEHYTQKMISIRDDWNVDEGKVKDFRAGDDLDGLLERLKENPDMGFPFRNGYYNALFRGMRKTKFLLRSGATGTGKTRQAIQDMCTVSCSHIYEPGRGWQSLGPSFPALLISTELEQEEVQVLMLAFLTGVPDSEIRNGDYDKSTHERLLRGIEILKESQFFVVYVEDFSISDIEMKIEQYIINESVEYVAFDYIQMVPKLSKTMNNAFGTVLREDQILVHFSAALKTLSNKYDIFLESSTQLNRGSKEVENRDASSLRGGLATADKIDYGVLSFKVNKADKDSLKHIIQQQGFDTVPNFSHWVYKNRAGRDHVIIWTKMDLGTMREETLFVTDYDYNLIDDLQEVFVKFDEDTPKESETTTMQQIEDRLQQAFDEEEDEEEIDYEKEMEELDF